MSSVNLENLSQEELNKILKEEYEKNKKLKKERSILLIKKLKKQNEKLSQVKSKSKPKLKSIPKPKFKPKSKSKQKIKTFNEYFQECIKNKTIPKDTPHYLKKALESAMKEYEEGIILEKSALTNFSEKYVIKGITGLIPLEYFSKKASQIKDFLRSHRNTKVRMVLVCEMERQIIEKSKGESKISHGNDNAYFQSQTHINLEKTEVKVFLKEMIIEILGNLIIYQKNGSGWYFKEIKRLEIHIVEYKPMRGGSYIPLPELIKKKNAITNIKNEDNKCFLWSILRYLHPKEIHLIKNFSRLVRSQITKDTTRKIHICKKCLNHYTKEELLEKHSLNCGRNETVAVKMPTKNSILKFQNHFKKLSIPFTIYADFECFTMPVSTFKPNPESYKQKSRQKKSYTLSYQKHEPSGYCLYIKALDGLNTNFKPIVYTKKTPDEDISRKFIKHVIKLTHQIYQEYYTKPKPLKLTSQEEKDFQSATKCHICEKDLFRDKITKKILQVRDHCHFTGEYR